jgi:hypothetical protein
VSGTPRLIRYRGHSYVLAEAEPVRLDMDRTLNDVRTLLRTSPYAQRFDHSSTQRFDDDLDVASSILVHALFHDVVFSEPRGNHAGFYSWLVQHFPRESTPAAVFGIVKGLRQHDPNTFNRIVEKVRPEALR